MLRGDRPLMFGAFSLQKDCRVEMGRLNSGTEHLPASCHLHGSHTAPDVGEGTKKTTSVDHLNHSIHSRRWNNLLLWRCRGTTTGAEEGVGIKLLFSPAVCTAESSERKGWCRTRCYLPTGGEMGQSFDSGHNFGFVGRHVCFLAFLQPADNSLHNAAAQIGSRGF